MALLEGDDRCQSTFITRSLDEQIGNDNPDYVIDSYLNCVMK